MYYGAVKLAGGTYRLVGRMAFDSYGRALKYADTALKTRAVKEEDFSDEDVYSLEAFVLTEATKPE